jgi:PQ loop repeat
MNTIILGAMLTSMAFAVVVPPSKYWIFREDCFDKLVAFDQCIMFSVFKGLGFGIVAGSCLFKLPQIGKMMAAKSADGVPAIALYAEFINLIGYLGNSLRL